jgi:hypothetical protein
MPTTDGPDSPATGDRVDWCGPAGRFAVSNGVVTRTHPDGSSDVAFGPSGSYGTVCEIPAGELKPATPPRRRDRRRSRMGWRERTIAHLRDDHHFTTQDFAECVDDLCDGDPGQAHRDAHEAAGVLRGTSLGAGNPYVEAADHRHD